MTQRIINSFVAASLFAAIAAPALAQTNAGTSATAPIAPSATTSKKTINVACIQGAIETRDSAIASAVTAHASAQTAALSARKTALKAAWALTDQKARRAALRDAWKAFDTASRAARKTHRDAQNAAWKQFNTDRKACGTGVSDDPGHQGHDSQL